MVTYDRIEGWGAVGPTLTGSPFMITGFMGTIAFTFLLIQSPSPIRHAFYEVFLHGHIVGAAIAVAGVWIHLNKRPQQLMLYGVVALWAAEAEMRGIRLVPVSVALGGSGAGTRLTSNRP